MELKIRIPVFYEGKFIRFDTSEIKITKGANSYAFGNCTYVGDYTLGEPQLFTGLKDKHGNPIFEGDIVRNEDLDCVVEYQAPEFVRHVIKHGLRNQIYPFKSHHEYEVVGNIHSNPELLK